MGKNDSACKTLQTGGGERGNFRGFTIWLFLWCGAFSRDLVYEPRCEKTGLRGF